MEKHPFENSQNLPININIDVTCDAPPNSLMDSTTSPNVKTSKGEGVGAQSLIRNTLGVEGHVKALRWDQGD